MHTKQSIRFDAEKHEYWLDEKYNCLDEGEIVESNMWVPQWDSGRHKLISVTRLLAKHGITKSYDNIDQDMLNAKAERGSLIHKYLEQFIKAGEKPLFEVPEVDNFEKWMKSQADEHGDGAPYDLQSETIVYNECVAGTVDFMYTVNNTTVDHYIADFKTSSAVDLQGVRWQLSLYAYLLANRPMQLYPNDEFEKDDYNDTKVIYNGLNLQCFHFSKDGELVVLPIEQIEYDEIEKLLECERNGTIYQTKQLDISTNALRQLHEAEIKLAEYEKWYKSAKEIAEACRDVVLQTMQAQGIKSFETADKSMLITVVNESTKSTIDSARLKKELPEIAEKYKKESRVKAFVKITLRGGDSE